MRIKAAKGGVKSLNELYISYNRKTVIQKYIIAENVSPNGGNLSSNWNVL